MEVKDSTRDEDESCGPGKLAGPMESLYRDQEDHPSSFRFPQGLGEDCSFLV